MFMSVKQNARHNQHTKRANKSMEKCHTQIEYLHIRMTDKVTYMKTLKAEETQ
jgi:hypothetical protein